MANKSSANLGKNQEEFEEKQSTGIDKLFNPAAPDKVDLVAAESVSVGILAKGMAAKINTTLLPGHEQLFREAYSPDGVEYINEAAKRAAFKRAFEAVYGRFLYDQEEVDEASMHPVLREYLQGDALNFALDERGLKDRPELVVAMRHLKMASLRKVDVADVIRTAFATIDPLRVIELEREHTSAVADRDALMDQYKYFSGKGPADIHEKYLAVGKSKLTSKELRELEAKVKKADADRGQLNGLKDTFSEAKTATLRDTLQEFEALGTTYDSTKSDAGFDEEITRNSTEVNFLEKEIAALIQASKRGSQPNARGGNPVVPDIGSKKIELETAKVALEIAQKKRKKRDEYRTSAKKLRGELQNYCRQYLVAFELNQGPTSLTKSEVEGAKNGLDSMNVETASDLKELRTIYDILKPGFEETFNGAKARLDSPDLDVAEKQNFEEVKKSFDKAKAFHADLKTMVDGIKASKCFDETYVNPLLEKFEAIKIDGMDFAVTQLTGFYETYLMPMFARPDGRKAVIALVEKKVVELNTGVKKKLKSLNDAKDAEKKNEKQSDTAKAKGVISELLRRQFPEMSAADLDKLSTMILADDLAKIQNAEGYDEIARRGSAKVLDTVQQVGFKAKLIEFKYKDGEKTVQPFKGMKPGDFANWAKIERLFNIGKINHQNGFFVLAAFEKFEGKTDDDGNAVRVPSIQSVQIEKKLKALLAKKLGVAERMNEAGVVSIVNEAFTEQLENVRPLVTAYFDHYDANRESWDSRKVEELNVKAQALKEEYKLGKIDEAQFEKRKAELVEEAEEFGLKDKVDFVQSDMMADYFDSPDSEWLRSIGHGVKEWAKGKGKGVGMSAARLTGFAALGTAKLAGSLAFQTAMAPLRLLKYPWMMTLGPIVNAFRTKPWTPLADIKNAVVSDASRIAGYAVEKTTGTVTGAREKITTVPAEEWKKTQFARVEYKDRTKLKLEELEAKAKEFKEKGESTPVEIEGSPFIDLDDYKAKIAKLDKMIARGGDQEKKTA